MTTVLQQTRGKSERELIIEDIKKRLSEGEKLRSIANYYGMSCKTLRRLANATPIEAAELLKDQVFLI
jgi:hypothetical protein